ncbi:actin filament-associated protein 1-like 1 [Lampris incognitus]|uniref:actin filament-associated protein 1-like 1 n=1 Tax=Lampris incognitus TaxID=2546036 RepID=UPI0024B48473|nr:actin filament-associated protein 1-like 1 [Lampris incognitus]
MEKQKVLARLMWDLQSFLSVLDSENLSYIAQAQKKSISELLAKLQDTPGDDAEYMIMSCPSLSPSMPLTDTSSTDVLESCLTSKRNSTLWQGNGSQDLVAVPHGSGSPDDEDEEDEEDTYEEAEPFIPESHTNTAEGLDSDSSHYESYGEEDQDEEVEQGEEFVKDRAHYIQWSASQPCLKPAPESRLCGYLWRKKWLGQWTKQLFVIRHSSLLCYKYAKDLLPHLESDLQGCQVVYKAKSSRKIQHELRVLQGSQTLVLGYNSYQQAQEWRRVIEQVSSGVEIHTSSSLRSDRPLSCRSSLVIHAFSEEEKPSTSCCLDNQDKGFLNVLMNCQWQSLQCQVEKGLLKMFGEEEEEEEGDRRRKMGERPPQYTLQLTGCEVKPGPDTEHSYRITLCQHGDQIAILEVSSLEDRDRWLQLLQDGAVSQNHHDDNLIQGSTDGDLRRLKMRHFLTSNMYMDDLFQLNGTSTSQPIYSNTSILEHMLQSSQDVTQGDSALSKDSVTYNNTVFTSHSE